MVPDVGPGTKRQIGNTFDMAQGRNTMENPNYRLKDEQLRELIEESSALIQAVDMDGGFLYVNKTWKDTMGYGEEDLTSLTIWDLLTPKSSLEYRKVLEKAKANEESGYVEMEYLTRQGSQIIVGGNASLLREKDGTPLGTSEFLKVKAHIDRKLKIEVDYTLEKRDHPQRGYSKENSYQGGMLQALEDQTSPMNMFLDSIHDLVFYKDLDGIYRGCNTNFANLLGLPKEKILGSTDNDLYPDDIAEFFQTRDKMIQNDLKSRRNEEWVTGNDGSRSYIETMKTPYWGPDHELMGFLGISRDITERKLTEEKLAENEKWLNMYFSQSMDAKFFMMLEEPVIWNDTIDREKNLDYIFDHMHMTKVNPAMLNQYRTSEGKLMKMTPRDIHSYDSQYGKGPWLRFLDKGNIHVITEDKRFDGTIMWIDADYSCLYDEGGLISGIFGTQRDITKEMEIEQEMKLRERYLRTVIETTQDGFLVLDSERFIIDVNESYCRMSGYSKEEILKLNIRDVNAIQTPAEAEIRYRKIAEEGPEIYETKHRRKEGSVFDVEISATSLGPNDPTLVCFCRDITERKQLESYFLIEKEQFQNTLQSAADGVISTDRKGRVIIMNQIAEELTGWKFSDAVGRPLEEVLHIIDEATGLENPNQAILAMAGGKTIEVSNNMKLITKSGETFFIESSAAPIKSGQEEITGAVVVFKDITRRREEMKNIEFLSFHDALTGLYNRRYLEDTFKRFERETDLPVAIMVIDVNGLKLTNDAFGHMKGDNLIKIVARICKEVSRSEDIVCRSGGDEFVLVLPNSDSAQAKALKERIITKAAKTESDSMVVSLAAGYAVKSSMEQDIMEIYAEADCSMYKNKLQYGKIMRKKTIETLMKKLNGKYEESESHNSKVADYAEAIARAKRMRKADVEDIRTAGLLHDIGKVMISDEILMKVDKLTERETKEVRQHPEIGYQILKEVDDYAHLAEVVLCHHEWWDGTGYPRGMKMMGIPLGSRIISVADAFETMTGGRAYLVPKSRDEAVEELRRCAGTQFDPEIVSVFIEKVLKLNRGQE